MVCPFVYIWSSVVCLLQGIQMTTRRRLCTIKGISEAKMEKIKEAATKLCVHFVLLFKICRLVTSQAFLFKNERLEKCVWNYISSLFYTPVLDKIVLFLFLPLSLSFFFFFFEVLEWNGKWLFHMKKRVFVKILHIVLPLKGIHF